MGEHVRHMGFELELAAVQIAKALAYVPEDARITIIEHLTPRSLRIVVKEMLEE